MSNEVTVSNPSWMDKYTGKGEGASDSEDRSMPFVTLCHPQSPAVIEGKAKICDLYLEAQEVSLGNEIEVVVIAWLKDWILWGDRKKKEGIIWRGREEMLTPEQAAMTKWRKNPNGGRDLPPLATETRTFIVVEYKDGVLNPRGFEPAPMVISFAKSNAKAGENFGKLITLSTGQGRHIYFRTYKISTDKKTVDTEQGPATIAFLKVEPSGYIKEEHATALHNMRENFKHAISRSVEQSN